MGSQPQMGAGWRRAAPLYAAFLAAELITFLPVTFSAKTPNAVEIPLRLGITAGWIVLTLRLRRSERFTRYWRACAAFGIASAAQFIDWHFSHWAILLFHLELKSAAGYAVDKLESTVLLVLTILVLTRLSGEKLSVLYLQRGKVKWWIPVSVFALAFFGGRAIPIAEDLFDGQNLSIGRVVPWMPWIAVFVCANGLNEELLFRGLFLKKLEPFLGARGSNVLIALVFAVWHMEVRYAPDVLVFLGIVFALGLGFGVVVQKTDSLWGAVLCHAAVDIPVIVGMLSTLD